MKDARVGRKELCLGKWRMAASAVYEVLPLLGPLKWSAAGIAVHSSTLYVSSTEGTLTVFKVSSGDGEAACALVSSIPKFAKVKSSLSQLLVVPEWDCLFSRCGAYSCGMPALEPS